MQQHVQRAYAAFELYLDLHEVLYGLVQSDLENVVIYACVAEATLRPHVKTDSQGAADVTNFSGAISRLLVADRTGLPRETVRRKIAMMLTSGQLVRVGRGSVAIAPQRFSERAEEISAAVARYQKRVGARHDAAT